MFAPDCGVETSGHLWLEYLLLWKDKCAKDEFMSKRRKVKDDTFQARPWGSAL